MLIERGLANETPAEREARLVYERAVIAQARAEIDAGLGIPWEDVERYFDALDKDTTTLFPFPTLAPDLVPR